jgi:protein TonB
MRMHRIGVRAHKACRALAVISGLWVLSALDPALAQTPPATPAPAAAGSDAAPSEAARRAALSPYRFILLNANAPARKPAPEPKKAAPVEQAAAQPRAAPAPAPLPPVAKSQPSPAPQPAPEPVAALTPKPAEPPPVAAVRREIIPIKTDEPHLPAALLREKPSGVVKVAFEVRPDGSTGAVKVVHSTNRSLNRASVQAVSEWKFEPVDEVLSVETELAFHYE